MLFGEDDAIKIMMTSPKKEAFEAGLSRHRGSFSEGEYQLFRVMLLSENLSIEEALISQQLDQSKKARGIFNECANAGCGNEGTKICQRCKVVCYCSRSCQVSHWRAAHKNVCEDATLPRQASANAVQLARSITSPALRNHNEFLSANPDIDYRIVLPTGNQDCGVIFPDPMGKIMFKLWREKAPEPPYVHRMYGMLVHTRPQYKKIIRQQLKDEYGIDPLSEEAKLGFHMSGKGRDESSAAGEHDDAYYASIDGTHDGLWVCMGLNGMMVNLDNLDEFMLEQEEEWDHDKAERPELRREDEFVELDLHTFEEVVGPSLRDRGLTVASGITRRLIEDDCVLPPLRITRVRERDMSELIATKQRGNEQFAAGLFENAFETYEDALCCVVEYQFYIAPASQVEEVVKILSNQVECQLRLHEYKTAAQIATDALILDSDHEKTRIRRAKAELALYRNEKEILPYLVQAKHDLEEVLDSPFSSKNGCEAAQILLEETNELIENERKKFEEESPDGNFDLGVRVIKSKCW